MNAHATGAEERRVRAADAPASAPASREPGQAAVMQSGQQPSDVVPVAAPASKFTYPGGSRPLSGYTIKRGIGRGGFGEVYYAISDGGKEVALKLLRRNFDVELRGVAQCLNLKHPNLLALYDIRTDDHDDCWVVMEFAAGPSLEEVIAQHPNGMPPAEAVAWLRGIAAGVGYLHDSGIVHRDIKPGNIFCDGGLVKIGDYGLSKFISCSRRSGQTESVGTVHYMAPEIANGRYGRGIDLYALGVMLHEMLTGRVPFEGESVAEVLMKHLTAQPDLSALQEPYRGIVGRALAKDPQQRYATVAELLAALPDLPAGSVGGYEMPRVAGATAASPMVDDWVALVKDLGLTEAALDRRHPSRAAVNALAGDVKRVVPQPAGAEALQGEPLQRWVRHCLRGLTTPVKVALIVIGLFLLPTPYGALAIVTAIGYGFYYCFWLIGHSFWSAGGRAGVRQNRRVVMQLPVAAPVTVVASTPAAAPVRIPKRRRWHDRPVPALVVRPLRQRLAELCGSLVLAAVVVLVMTLVMVLLRGESATPEQFAWLSLVGILGAWGVLVPAKFWEGTRGDPVLRRFCMLVVGLGVGLSAYGIQQSLWVSLPHEFSVRPAFAGHRLLLATDGVTAPLSLMTCLTYFGFLFLLIRWWRLANPLRSTRLSPWATAVCVTCAIALYLFWPFPQRWDVFPQSWGFLVTAIIAIAVQLASPWQRNDGVRIED